MLGDQTDLTYVLTGVCIFFLHWFGIFLHTKVCKTDLFYRFLKEDLNFTRPAVVIGQYRSIKHGWDTGNPKSYRR